MGYYNLTLSPERQSAWMSKITNGLAQDALQLYP